MEGDIDKEMEALGGRVDRFSQLQSPSTTFPVGTVV